MDLGDLGIMLFYGVGLAAVFVFAYVVQTKARRELREGRAHPQPRWSPGPAALTGLLGLRRISAGPSPVGVIAEGLLPTETRRVSVSLLQEHVGYVRFKLDLDPKVHLSLRKKGLLDIGLERFGSYVLGTDDRARFENTLARVPALKTSIDEAFALGVEHLLLWEGELRADATHLRREDYPVLLRVLADIARTFDPIGIRVQVLGDRELRAIRGANGDARCSYCHDHVTGAEPDLVACAACNTVLHDACWKELGRCPVLGCSGSVPERGRVATR